MSNVPLALVPEGVRVGHALVRLTRAERALLGWLVAHMGEPQPAERLLRDVWQYRDGVSSRTVVSTVHRLRTKLEAVGGAGWIRTVPGQGYALQPVEPASVSEGELAGRQAELATLCGWLASDGRLLMVTGPPGVGKSALVAAALRSPSRIDLGQATLGSALQALEAAPAGADTLLWLDDADPVLLGLAPHLGTQRRRLIVTCRYAVDLENMARLHLEPLAAKSTRALLDRWLAARFPSAAPSEIERARRVKASGGNPVRLRQILWEAEGAGPPPGPERHRTEGEMLAWGLLGLSAEAATVLRRLCAVPCAVDDETAGVLVGRSDPRPVLATLRDRGLVEEDNGCWSVPDALREVVPSDPAGVEPLLRKVVADATSGALDPDLQRIGARFRAAWGLLTWATTATDDSDDFYLLLQGLDHHAIWAGPQFDSRPYLALGLERLPEDDHWWILRRQARAEIRHGLAPDSAQVQQLMRASVALADRDDPPGLGARSTWVEVLIAGGQFHQALEIAQDLAQRARSVRDAEVESWAHALAADALLWAGRLQEAAAAVRLARVVDPQTARPWQHAGVLGRVLGGTGRTVEAATELQSAAVHLRQAGRMAFASIYEAGAWWTKWASGEAELEETRAKLTEAWEAVGPPIAAGVAQDLAVLELVAGRFELAARWLRHASPFRRNAAEVRTIGAAIHASLGVAVRWDELPEPSAEADPQLGILAYGFAHAAVGHRAQARLALDAVAPHTGLLFRALSRVLEQLAPP